MTSGRKYARQAAYATRSTKRPEPGGQAPTWHLPRSRRLAAEAVGTFFLVLVAAGSGVAAALSHSAVGPAATAVAPGAMVLALVYTLGETSGAHLNPAVTLAFAARRDFPWRWVPGYLLAQCTGAIAAAGLLRALFGTAGDLGVSVPRAGVGDSTALVLEVVLTLGLVTVILGTASGARNIGHNAAIAVGCYVALAGLWSGPLGGASMNPARSLAPPWSPGIPATSGPTWSAPSSARCWPFRWPGCCAARHPPPPPSPPAAALMTAPGLSFRSRLAARKHARAQRGLAPRGGTQAPRPQSSASSSVASQDLTVLASLLPQLLSNLGKLETLRMHSTHRETTRHQVPLAFISFVDVRFRPWALTDAHRSRSPNGPQAHQAPPITVSSYNLTTVQTSRSAVIRNGSSRTSAEHLAAPAGGRGSRSITHQLRIVTFQAVCCLERVLPGRSRYASRPALHALPEHPTSPPTLDTEPPTPKRSAWRSVRPEAGSTGGAVVRTRTGSSWAPGARG
ncbi:aquaporin [Kitasatospora acidiphila]|uniref:Aquaporin n=1 Tax=Kitasatospora acidiphila TaxID=2567942 RepID=A0A540W1C0_9ACTN|nr:aquaporin [Kitasatospora acidiphila]